MGTRALIKSDYSKIRKYGEGFFSIMLNQSFWAIFQYRIANRIYYSGLPKWLRKFLFVFTMLWQKLVEIMTGITIPAGTKIGHSFYIGHFGGVHISPFAVIGNNCNLSQGVTIGVGGTGKRRGVPVIGDNVYVGANAVLAGPITVSNNVLVAAASLLVTDAPEDAVMMGVPATIQFYSGSRGYI